MDNLEQRLSRLSPKQRELLQIKMEQMNKQKQKSRILLPLQEGDPTKKRPVFCLHPPLGVTGYFINLVRHMPADQTVYGIQSPAFYNIRVPFDDMSEMAEYYLNAMRTVQADPPYMLLAHSSGAYIAYEMAMQLQNHTENIPTLIFIDQPAPIGPLDEIMDAFKDPNLTESNEALFLTTWLVSLIHNQPLSFSLEDLKALSSLNEKYELVTGFLKQSGFIPQNADTGMVKTVLQMIANHAMADHKYHEKYTPDGASEKYHGRTVLMRCTQETYWQGLDATSPADTSEYSNWDKFCDGPIDVIGIADADHITMVLKDNCVKDIAEKLQPYLDEVTPTV